MNPHPLMERLDLGSEGWWAEVARAGTPLQRALPGDEVELTFLWRGAATWNAVYIDVYSHTPHPTRGPTALRRIGQSDVWEWCTRLPADWRGSYFFVPASEPAPADGLRRWWRALIASAAQADTRNPHPPHGGGWGLPLSPLVLPAARVHPAWSAPPAARPERLLRQRWSSQRLGNQRDVWLYRGGFGPADGTTRADLPLAILLDGQYWARNMPVFGALDTLPPALYVLVDAIDPATRARELPCCAAFWEALQDELLPQVSALQAFTRDPARTLVAGQSFGGLAALYAGLYFPRRFGQVLSQSGSFWWPDPDEAGLLGWLTQQVLQRLAPPSRLDVLIEAGSYEGDMRAVSVAMASVLKAAGHRASFQEFRGGHDPLCWRDGLLAGVARFLTSLEPEPSR